MRRYEGRVKEKSERASGEEASTPMPQQKHRVSELKKDKPRAERVGTQKSVAAGPRAADWAEDSGSPQRSKAVWDLRGSRAAQKLRPSLGGKGWGQHKREGNIKGEQGDPGNDPSQINEKDAIKSKKRPAGDGATPRRELRR